jgi:hypothetical protein
LEEALAPSHRYYRSRFVVGQDGGRPRGRHDPVPRSEQLRRAPGRIDESRIRQDAYRLAPESA